MGKYTHYSLCRENACICKDLYREKWQEHISLCYQKLPNIYTNENSGIVPITKNGDSRSHFVKLTMVIYTTGWYLTKNSFRSNLPKKLKVICLLEVN